MFEISRKVRFEESVDLPPPFTKTRVVNLKKYSNVLYLYNTRYLEARGDIFCYSYCFKVILLANVELPKHIRLERRALWTLPLRVTQRGCRFLLKCLQMYGLLQLYTPVTIMHI